MKMIKLFPWVLCAALVFGSCDDDDDKIIVPEVVSTSFAQQYPQVKSVKWEEDSYNARPYLKAEFRENGVEVEVWYTYEGTWVRTERDYKGTLPQAVSDYINTNYPGYRIDDMEWIETPEQHYYQIELEKGKNDVELCIQENGTVIYIQDDNHKVPASVEQSFAERYPNAVVREWERENQYLKAEFLLNNVEAEAWFTYDGVWVKTETDFHGTLPQAVTDYINTHYAGYRIDDINWVESPEKNYFEIDLERGKEEIELTILEDGTFINAIPDID